MAYQHQGLSRFCCVIGFCVSASTSYGLTFSGAMGAFDPDDGIVQEFYDTGPVYSFGAGFAHSPTLYWTLTGTSITLKTRVHDLQASASLFLVNTGFRKYFPEAGPPSSVAPFFGAGVSAIHVSELLKEDQGKSVQLDPLWINGTFWEVGLLLPLRQLEHSWIEVFLLEQHMDPTTKGRINLGGRVLALGYQHRFE